MKKCPYCSAELNDENLFCTECGKELPKGIVCPHCGISVNDGDSFCQNCGKKIGEISSFIPSESSQKRCPHCGTPINDCLECGKVINEKPTSIESDIVKEETPPLSKEKLCPNCGKELEEVLNSNDNPNNETSLKEKENTPDNYTNLSGVGKNIEAESFSGSLPYMISVIVLVMIGIGIWWYYKISNQDTVKEDDPVSAVTKESSITMNCGGWIGGESCFDFQVDGTSGYYLLTPGNQDGVKRTLSLEKFDPNTGECVINAYLRNNYIGKFEGKVDNIEKQDGRYLCNSFSGAFISVKGARLDFSLYSVGLTFRTFTEKESVNGYDGKAYTVQSSLRKERTIANLKQLGFKLVNSKTEKRLDNFGVEYEVVTIETYSKIINGNTTTVLLETDYTEIHFSNIQDVEIFKQSAINCGLKNKGDKLEDISQIYWTGTDVVISGTTVTLEYRWEA